MSLTSGVMTERVAMFDNSQSYGATGRKVFRRLPYNLVRYDHGGFGYEAVQIGQECWAAPGSNQNGVVLTGIQIVFAPDGVIPDTVIGGGSAPGGELLSQQTG